MWKIDRGAGRLITVRIASPVTDAEQASFGAALAGHVKAVDPHVLLCTDLRAADTFAPTVADRFVSMMKADNPKLLRSAFLVAGSATFGLQIERLIREAGHPHRRAFRDRERLLAFLGDVADEAESAGVTMFLDT